MAEMSASFSDRDLVLLSFAFNSFALFS